MAIAITTIVFLLIIIGGVWYIFRNRKKKPAPKATKTEVEALNNYDVLLHSMSEKEEEQKSEPVEEQQEKTNEQEAEQKNEKHEEETKNNTQEEAPSNKKSKDIFNPESAIIHNAILQRKERKH